MRRNTLIVLLALVAALAGTFAWLQRERAAEVPALPAAERWLPELDSATLSGLHMQFADGSPDIRVERRAGAWVLPAKADYPADRLRLSALLDPDIRRTVGKLHVQATQRRAVQFRQPALCRRQGRYLGCALALQPGEGSGQRRSPTCVSPM